MTNLQTKFLSILDDYGWDVFNRSMLSSTNQLSDYEVTQAIRFLTKSGTIIKLEQGKYRRRPFANDFVIGTFLVQDGGIAYWNAMNYHELTEQFPNLIFIQNSKRNGEFISDYGVKFRFIRLKKNKVTGYKNEGYGNHQYRITNLEKTIVDCFDLPQYSGGYPEIIKAYSKAKPSPLKLVKYCKIINNISVVKRLAFLTELLKKPGMEYFIKYALSVVNKKYNLFEPGGIDHGKIDNRWHLIVNMDIDEITERANS